MDMVNLRRVLVTGPGPLRGHVIEMKASEAALLVAQGHARYIADSQIQHAVRGAREDMMRRN